MKNMAFGKNFILWVKILIGHQESFDINVGATTKYFSPGGRARQDDPILALLFILHLEILFILIKSKPEIERMTISD